jgi:hypothetical protein
MDSARYVIMMTKDEDAQSHVLETLLGSSQRTAPRWRMLFGALIVVVWILTMASFTRAGFATNINSTPLELHPTATNQDK